MLKKFALGFSAIALAVASVPMFAAFEAHVINVTARIENALTVDTRPLDFGTVFPQEHLEKRMSVALSQSFKDEGRVDDVKYFIRQKPKCGITTDNGTVLVSHETTATGHVIVGDNPLTEEVVEEWWIDCGRAPRQLETNEIWGLLPSLCEYVSKHDDQSPDNDDSKPSFHKPFTVVNGEIDWNDTNGYLSKDAGDVVDDWTIDLAVPCFGGHCAQDWADFVHGINPDANPAEYVQDGNNEHKVFGCDLWVEVGGVSLTEDLPPLE